MSECKTCYISNHDSTALGLTFVLFGKSPKLKTSAGWVEAGWQSGWLSQGFVFLLFFGELFRHSSLGTEGFRDQEFKTIAVWNASSFQYATNLCPHLRKESARYFILYLIKDFNSTMEQQLTEQIQISFTLTPRRNIKLIAAKHFNDWKYCVQ